MITCNQGDIVLISFPFTDFSASKQRPAIIISSNTFNNSHDDVIIMAITSQIPNVIAADEYLLNNEEIQKANLPKASLIKVGKITTINKLLIRKNLGILPNVIIQKLKSIFINNIF